MKKWKVYLLALGFMVALSTPIKAFAADSLYRLYNSSLQVHLYTKDKNEYQTLASRGWKQEGIAFYGYGNQTGRTKPNATRTEIKIKEEVLPYQTVYEKDATLLKGQEIVVRPQGQNGKRSIQVTTVIDTKTGKILKQNKQTIAETPPVHRVIRKGILLDMRQMSSLAANQEVEVGDVFPSGASVLSIELNHMPSLSDIHALSDELIYQRSKVEAGTMVVNSGHTLGIPLTQGAVNYVNKQIDMAKLNQEMLVLLNAERSRLGRAPLIYGQHLQQGASQRALEQAQIGNLRSANRPHIRPDGTSWSTAFSYLDGTGYSASGENIAQNSAQNFYHYFSEKALAEQFYKQWKNSPGHYANMTAEFYKYIAFSVQVGINSDIGLSNDFSPTLIGVQSFGQ